MVDLNIFYTLYIVNFFYTLIYLIEINVILLFYFSTSFDVKLITLLFEFLFISLHLSFMLSLMLYSMSFTMFVPYTIEILDVVINGRLFNISLFYTFALIIDLLLLQL